jgi:hypothetical protein
MIFPPHADKDEICRIYDYRVGLAVDTLKGIHWMAEYIMDDGEDCNVQKTADLMSVIEMAVAGTIAALESEYPCNGS